MRCQACNNALNEGDSKRKDPSTGAYMDTCGHCLSMGNLYSVSKREEIEKDVAYLLKSLYKE